MPDPTSLIERALDPSRSVVVEACAGSGKTWLLASRVVRLLLAGVAPGEVLAITFTRKAAREIEERVVGWLRDLATKDDTWVAAFLAERGVTVGSAGRTFPHPHPIPPLREAHPKGCEGEGVSADEVTLSKARGLYEQVLSAQPGLTVNTFHGWFLQLVDAAPLSANLAGAKLVESDSRLFDELWQSFAADLQKALDSELTQAFVRLLGEAGRDSARRLIRRALDRRSEWLALGDPDFALTNLRELLAVGEQGQALRAFFACDWTLDFQDYLGLLEMSELAGDQAAAAQLRAALASAGHSGLDPESSDEPRALHSWIPGQARNDGEVFETLRSTLLTKENTLRQKKPGKAADKRFGVDGAVRFFALHAQLGERLIACVQQQIEERVLAFNADAILVFAAFLAHVEAFKQARRQIDFVDAEWNVLKLLRDEQTAAFLQARLDARYSHVLLDEFQDTNPLQWQILLGWLGAYSDDSRPQIFMVGDPKQSIYRFRRAEPRLFAAASDFLQREFGAVYCAQDATRRNAPAIVDVVNALFRDEAAFAPFREQSSFAAGLPGRVELLPLFGKGVVEEIEETEPRATLRDPLTEPALEAEDLRLQQEAAALAERIAAMVGHWAIEAKGSDGLPEQRALRYGDIMLLVRTRTNLACYERALSAANIPFDAGSRGGLLGALEVRDIVALLEFLVMPADDLKLAHALRSPVFTCSDEELMQLATKDARHSGLDPESSGALLDPGFRRDDGTWWSRLVVLSESDQVSPRLARAARLLGEWLQAADRLPAHDLLDRIFDQGEVIARYRLAVPAAMAAGVEANLRALLLLALDLDGGRYPSLPRCIDELRDLRDADANDAPDEGEIETQHADAGRVRILTIHGAKGLEAPVVWLLGANATPRPPDPWDVLVDWPPEAPAPQHFSFYGRKDDRGTKRQPLFELEEQAAKREELNLLYVAMTRARQVFIASGIENAKEKGETPYRRLEAALEKLGGVMGSELAYGDELPTGKALTVTAAAITHHESMPLPPTGERRPAQEAGERFGTLLHAVLERRTDAHEKDGWWKALGFDDAEYRRVLPAAERILAAPALQRFFDPAQYRRAWNEVDLSGANGELLRIDRLVAFDDDLWVLDYKSSGGDTAWLEAYRVQVKTYCQAVESVFVGRVVRGVLLFADGSLREV